MCRSEGDPEPGSIFEGHVDRTCSRPRCPAPRAPGRGLIAADIRSSRKRARSAAMWIRGVSSQLGLPFAAVGRPVRGFGMVQSLLGPHAGQAQEGHGMAIQQLGRHVPHVEHVTTTFAEGLRTGHLIFPPRRTSSMGEPKWSASSADAVPQSLSRGSIFRPVAFSVAAMD